MVFVNVGNPQSMNANSAGVPSNWGNQGTAAISDATESESGVNDILPSASGFTPSVFNVASHLSAARLSASQFAASRRTAPPTVTDDKTRGERAAETEIETAGTATHSPETEVGDQGTESQAADVDCEKKRPGETVESSAKSAIEGGRPEHRHGSIDKSESLKEEFLARKYDIRRKSVKTITSRAVEPGSIEGKLGGAEFESDLKTDNRIRKAEEAKVKTDGQLGVKVTVSEPIGDQRSEVVAGDEKMTKTQSDTSDVSRAARRKAQVRGPGHVSHQFFHVEPCLYTHRMFQRAAVIFAVLKDSETETMETKAQRRRAGITAPTTQEKIPDMEFIDAHEQIKTFELAFATLKYQKLFQEILDNTVFFSENNDLREAYSLVCIILYDLQSRKFQRRTPHDGEQLDDLCYKVEEALLFRKTRLLSTIAKERIRHGAPSLEFLLPEQVRHKDETKSRIPVYTWVNLIKLSMADFLEDLCERGFTQIEDSADMSDAQGRVYRVDKHCPDLVVFPPHLAMYFKDSEWVRDGSLVQQDKSSCLAPYTVHYILTTDHDVIHVNVGTGMSTAHMASLLQAESPKSHFYGFGVDSPDKARKVIKNLDMLGVKNTKILLEDFLTTDPEDYRFRNVRIIFITANCSKSAITSPVQFIVSEGEDMQILGELSKAESNMAHVGNLAKKHERQLKHALKFPKLQAVVYSTRSRYEAENESVITRSIDFVNQMSGKKMPFKVSPPVIPFASEEIDPSNNSLVDGRFIRFKPTDKANGCFVAIISREPEDPLALTRGRSKSDHSAKKSRKGKKKGQSTGGSRNASSLPDMTSRERQEVKKAQSARVFQATIVAKLTGKGPRQASDVSSPPGNVKIVRHPAPFSKPLPRAVT